MQNLKEIYFNHDHDLVGKYLHRFWHQIHQITSRVDDKIK